MQHKRERELVQHKRDAAGEEPFRRFKSPSAHILCIEHKTSRLQAMQTGSLLAARVPAFAQSSIILVIQTVTDIAMSGMVRNRSQGHIQAQLYKSGTQYSFWQLDVTSNAYAMDRKCYDHVMFLVI